MPEEPDIPDTGKTEAGKPTTEPGKGWVRLGFAVLTAGVLACLVLATVAAHEFLRLLEWAWAIS